jgi:hypothetical protein
MIHLLPNIKQSYLTQYCINLAHFLDRVHRLGPWSSYLHEPLQDLSYLLHLFICLAKIGQNLTGISPAPALREAPPPAASRRQDAIWRPQATTRGPLCLWIIYFNQFSSTYRAAEHTIARGVLPATWRCK